MSFKIKRVVTGPAVAVAVAAGVLTVLNPTTPEAAAALGLGQDRIGVLQGGHLLVKEGAPGANWGMDDAGVSDFQLEGDRVAALVGKKLLVKEGRLDSSYETIADGVDKFQLDGDRIAVLIGGRFMVKDGGLNAGWDLDDNAGVTDFEINGDRVAALVGGQLLVKDGHLKNNWTPQEAGVRKLDITGSRIGILKNDGSVWVKQGGLLSDWVDESPGGSATDFSLEADRIAALVGKQLWVKEGDLQSAYKDGGFAVDRFEMSGQRLAVWQQGRLLVKQGPLQNGWSDLGVTDGSFDLAGDRVGALVRGQLWVKSGALNAVWTENVAVPTKFQLEASVNVGLVTIQDLRNIYGTVASEDTVAMGLPGLNAEMVKAGITTPARKAAFIATLRHESNWRYNAVENPQVTYTGRGFIQLTAEFNYRGAGDYLRLNLIGNPGLAASIEWSAPIAGWYWTVARNINYYADRLDMGGVNGAIGYAPDAAEDVRRCDDFKKALTYFNGGALPGGVNCTRHFP